MTTRSASANLLSHMAGGVTTLSYLWVITRTDDEVFYFTDADEDIVYGGNTYKSANSGEMSSIDQKSDLGVDNFDYNVILSDDDIDKDDVIGGLFDFADVKVYIINRESVADGVMKIISGKLGEVRILDDYKAEIEFRSLTQLLSQGIGRTYTHECDADLGDDRCGVDLESSAHPEWTVDGTVTDVTDNQTFEDSGRGEADDYFNYGLITWTGGNNNGLVMEIKDFTNDSDQQGEFVLASPMPFTVQAGDTYTATIGCDKQKSTCKDTFDNLVNFRGFAEIPGADKVSRIPDQNPNAGLHD